MRQAKRKALTVTLLIAACLVTVGVAFAGGPLVVRSTGQPFVWNTAAAISYRTDNGPLSASVNEAAAQARVATMFNVWTNVNTATISYVRGGFINATGAFGGGDVNTLNEYNAVEASCGNGTQSPVVYDADGAIFMALGVDETAVIGFAGPCALSATQILAGQVVMNGLFQDGQAAPVPDIPAGAYDAAIVHEIGHFSGLDHSQINVNCFDVPCSNDDEVGLPTMFPFLVFISQGVLSVDDIAWISRLYPQTAGGTTFANTHGTITGTVLFSDGQSHAQSVNVIARRVDAGGNEDRRIAASVISGFRFTGELGNPILGNPASPFGTTVPADVGLFEIPVPAGSYTVEVESIHPEFVAGSSIGNFPIAMPGTAPAPTAAVAVAAGATVSVGNIVLIGTDPRFDQFEGP